MVIILEKTEKRKKFIIDIIFYVIVIAIIYLSLKYLFYYVIPFLIAIFISYVLQKPINWLSKKTKLSQRICSVIMFLIGILVFVSIVGFLIYLLISEGSSMINQLPNFVREQLPAISKEVSQTFSGILEKLPIEIQTMLENSASNFTSSIQSNIINLSTSLLSFVANIAKSLPKLLLDFIITIIATFFLTVDYHKVIDFFMRQVPSRHHHLIRNSKEVFVKSILKMLKSYLIIIGITYCELAIGFSIINIIIPNSIPYALSIAVLVAIVDILPILGTGTVLIPWSVILLITGNITFGICIILLYAIITIARNVIEPRIIGKQVGLHPLITLFFMYIGLQLFGFIGMIALSLLIIVLVKMNDSGKISLWK